MMYLLTEQEHIFITQCLEHRMTNAMLDTALAMLKAMKPVEHIAELMWDEEKQKSYMQYTMPIGLLLEGSKLYAGDKRGA